MRAPITPKGLLEQDSTRLKNLFMLLKRDPNTKDMSEHLLYELQKFKPVNIANIFQKRDEFDTYVWHNILRDPSYKKGTSFVFTTHPHYLPLDEKGQAFEKRFLFLLTDKIYHLDKTQDRRDLFRAMLIAYKETVDPKISEKLQYLNGIKFTLSRQFFEDMALFIKSNLI